MTSGQGPQGQPPPWHQPGLPPYGQPGPGPYGPPPWGYPPAPGVPQPPPEPKERPLSVRAGLGGFIVSIVLGLAGSAFAFAHWDDYVGQALAEQPEFEDGSLERAGIDPHDFATIFLVASLLFTLLHVLFVWFAWRGHNWARIVLFVLGGLGIVSGLLSLAGAGSSPFPSLTVLSLFSFAAVVVGVVMLARRDSSEWYAHEKWRRSLIR